MDGDDLKQFGWGQLDVATGEPKAKSVAPSAPDPSSLVESQDGLPNPFGSDDAQADEQARADQEAFAHATGDGFLDDDPQDDDQPPLELAVDPATAEAERRAPAAETGRVVERPDLAPPEPNPVEGTSPYPPAPTTWWASVPYTLAVLARAPSIREEVRFARKQQRSTSETHYDALVRLGRAHKAVAASGDFEEFFDRAEAAETSLSSSRVLQDQAKRSEQAEQHAVESQMHKAANRARGMEIKESRLAGRVQTKVQNLERIQARIRRVEIELRNRREAEEAEEPDGATGDEPALIEELKARQAEAATAGGALRKLEDELGAVRRELATSHGTVQAEQERLEQLSREVQRMNKARADSEAAATRDLEDALAELGLAALERGLPGTPRDALTAARAAQARLEEAEALLAVSRSRLDSWDRGTVKRGTAVVLGTATLVGLLLMLLN